MRPGVVKATAGQATHAWEVERVAQARIALFGDLGRFVDRSAGDVLAGVNAGISDQLAGTLETATIGQFAQDGGRDRANARDRDQEPVLTLESGWAAMWPSIVA